MKNTKLLIAMSVGVALLSGCASTMDKGTMAMPFSGADSVDYSEKLWGALSSGNFVGNSLMAHKPYKGTHPHGAVLETLSGTAKIDGYTGKVIVKRNYGGPGVSISEVSSNRSKYLKAVTVMYKRENGYDSDNQNWFWAKYKPDGSLHTNPKGMKLAGRVAKGKPLGCISCHKVAPGGDYMFLQ